MIPNVNMLDSTADFASALIIGEKFGGIRKLNDDKPDDLSWQIPMINL
jgi:hypothetical protein